MKNIHPKGSAKKVFDEFWKKAENDTCDRKTLASIAFDAGHSLRHENEKSLLKKQLFQRLEFSNFILMVDDLLGDCKSVYKSGSDLDISFRVKFIKIKAKIKAFSDRLSNDR